MFKLKYKITPEDMQTLNKSIMWAYFIPYLCVSLIGTGAGIAATVLKPRTEILVLGIILIVLGVILLGCTALLAIAPKNFVASVLLTSDETERTVIFGENDITIQTPDQTDIIIDYGEISKVKNKQDKLVAYLGKDEVFIIKDAIEEGGTLSDLFAFLTAKKAAPAPSTSAQAQDSATEEPDAKENDAEEAAEEAEEKADGGDAVNSEDSDKPDAE